MRWLPTGAIGLAAILGAIRSARTSIRLEMYIFREGPPGRDFGVALTAAAARGVRVAVHLDALGSRELPDSFWTAFRRAGGEVRLFHPFGSGRYWTRSHRKLCVVDEVVAHVAGFNIAPEYDGDGVTAGWLDVGVEIRGPSVAVLTRLFDEQYERPDRRSGLLARYRKRLEPAATDISGAVQILPVNPGRQASSFLRTLYADLPAAGRVWLCSPYFLPPPHLRRMLGRAARRGADVRLILPVKNDVSMARLAARRLYAGLFRNGVQVYEYLPQMVHAKVYLIDQTVYVGSSNLDPRSLYLNHELMIRSTEPELVAAAEQTLLNLFRLSCPVDSQTWYRSRSWTEKLRERWSFFLLYRLDPWLTRSFTPVR